MSLLSQQLHSVLGFALGILLAAKIVAGRRAPSSALAWLLAIALVPVVGVPLYLVFGERKVRRRPGTAIPKPDRSPFGDTAVERALVAIGAPAAKPGHRVELLATGEAAYEAVLLAIRNAKESIYVATFILGNDSTGNAVVSAMAERARAGVDVRLLIDGFFAPRASSRAIAELRRAGGRFSVFVPIFRLPWRGHANLRNHRKLLVADGRIAIVGGMNLAREYMGERVEPGRWRDLCVRIEGPVVSDLEAIFARDWRFAAHDTTPEKPAAPGKPAAPPTAHDSVVQAASSGPDEAMDSFYDAVLTGLFSAQRRVWLATPYFIPDEALVRALTLAIRRGVDVRVFVPARSNHLSADLAGAGYLREVVDAGGRVLRYQPGMLHAKSMILDDAVAIIGSANLDMRSLFLDYEVSVFLYSREDIDRLEAWFDGLTAESLVFEPPTGRFRAVVENVGRLLAPVV